MDRRRVSCVQQGHTARPQQRRLRPRVVTAQHIHIRVPGAWMQRIALVGKAILVQMATPAWHVMPENTRVRMAQRLAHGALRGNSAHLLQRGVTTALQTHTLGSGATS